MEKPMRFAPTRRTFLKAVASGAGAVVTLPSVSSLGTKIGYPDLALLRAQHEKKGIIPPDKTYRMMEWEFHTPPDEHFNINLDAATKAARDAGAEAVMFYSQDHWGYAYYPSEVAVRHPHLNLDLFGTEVSCAHKLGMSVTCYYSLQFNTQIVLSHPDWGWVDEKGELQRWAEGEGDQRQWRWYMTSRRIITTRSRPSH